MYTVIFVYVYPRLCDTAHKGMPGMNFVSRDRV